LSLTFPLSIATFASKLRIRQVKWGLQDYREFSGMGSGQILEADLAPQLWQGDVTLGEAFHYDSRKIEAMCNAVIRSMGTFYLYDPRTAYPFADRTGAILGASVVKINSLVSAKALTLKGLPSGYQITAGDYLSWDYGSAPVRRAFHEFSEDIVANGSGITGAVEVSPFIRTGAAVDQIVTLIKPAVMCKIKPASLSIESTGNILTSQVTFSVIQKG
jgi:hypothetical protein